MKVVPWELVGSSVGWVCVTGCSVGVDLEVCLFLGWVWCCFFGFSFSCPLILVGFAFEPICEVGPGRVEANGLGLELVLPNGGTRYIF